MGQYSDKSALACVLTIVWAVSLGSLAVKDRSEVLHQGLYLRLMTNGECSEHPHSFEAVLGLREVPCMMIRGPNSLAISGFPRSLSEQQWLTRLCDLPSVISLTSLRSCAREEEARCQGNSTT